MEVKTLEFQRGSSRESDWYAAKTPFGVKYIVAKNKKGSWDCVRPGCQSAPLNRPVKGSLQEAVEFCQTHFNKLVAECVFGYVESKRPQSPEVNT